MSSRQQGDYPHQAPVLGVIIPVFNTTQFFPILFQKLQHLQNTLHSWKMEVLIVDDGSDPPVQPILYPGLRIHQLRHTRNRGKGRALKTGFHFFCGRPEVKAIVTMDADLQHPPEYIPAMIKTFQSSGADVVLGYRRRIPGVMPFHRILSNLLTSLIISLLVGRIVRDSQCGFRLYRKQVLQGLPMERNGFHLESELALRLGWRKVSLAFVEIPTIYQGQPSAIRNVADTLDFILMITKLSFHRWFGHV